MNDLRPLSHVVITTLYIVASITILMRVYVRWIAMRSFGWDDWAMGVMLVFNSCQQGLLYFFLQYGGGLHIEQVMTEHPEWMAILTRGLLVEEFWYIWMQFVIKMCFLLFYLRLSRTPRFRLAVWSVVGFHIATTLVIWLLYAFQCIPLAAFYDAASYPGVKCLSTNITYFVPYTLNMATDICILVLPIPVIWSLQMTLERRLKVLAVITTGGSAVLVSGLRAIILFQFGRSTDFTWTLGKMVIISNVEMQVAILAANMPSLKAFYTLWRKHRLGPGQGVEDYTSSSRQKGSASLAGVQDNVELESGMSLSRHKSGKDLRGQDEATLTLTESAEGLFEGADYATEFGDRSDREWSTRFCSSEARISGVFEKLRSKRASSLPTLRHR